MIPPKVTKFISFIGMCK